MKTFTRKNTATEETTVLDFNAAVDQFIEDNLIYAGEDITELDEWLSDMSTVFETRSMLDEVDTEIDAGHFIYQLN